MRSELEAMTAQKRLELSIMSVMPMAIVLYMKLTARSFMEPLYHGIKGIALMSVSLLIYGASVAMGDHIITKVTESI